MLLPLLPPSVITSKRHTFTVIPYQTFAWLCGFITVQEICSVIPCAQISPRLKSENLHQRHVFLLNCDGGFYDVLKMSKHFFFFFFYPTGLWLELVHSYVSVVSSVHAWGNFSTSCSVIFWVPQRFSLWFYRVKQHHAVLDMLQQICFISCIHPTMD